MAKLDGYTLAEKIRKARRIYPITATEQALYHELVAICNDVEWRDVFPVSNAQLCEALDINEKTLIRARNTLIQQELIFYKSGKSRRSFGSYSFTKRLTTVKNTVDTTADTTAIMGANATVDVTAIASDLIETETKTETKTVVPAAPSPPTENKISIKKKINEEKPPEPYWEALVKIWFDFNQKEFGDEPSFEREDPKILKRIIHRLKKRAEEKKVEWTEVTAPVRFKSFLDKSFSDQWLCTNFLLSNLEKQFDKIILNQNGKQIKKTGQHTGVVQPRVVDTNENWGR